MHVYCRLDGKHVVFGSVTSGMEIVKKMESYGSKVSEQVNTVPIIYTCIYIFLLAVWLYFHKVNTHDFAHRVERLVRELWLPTVVN